MQVLYGTPLPPGLVAPTRGELRLRVDQLLLDDDAINYNPLVHLFDRETSQDASLSDTLPGTSSRSPNRFVVPVDYCAVGPIFWGETRPTAHGQPSTPQLRRGPLTMAYAIKVEPEQFRAYLQRMTASPQGGVLLDIFVPPSYSGRPPVTVGKARLALDHLEPGRPVQGWYPVHHRRSQASTAAGGDSAASGAAAGVVGEEASLKEIPVGKVKVSVSIEYYPTTRYTQHRQQASGKHHRHAEVSGSGAAALPQAKTRRSARQPGRGGRDAGHFAAGDSFASSASSSSEDDVGDGTVKVYDSHRLRVHSQPSKMSALAPDLTSATQRLLEQGLRLRAQMEAAARGEGVDDDGPRLRARGHSAQRDGNVGGHCFRDERESVGDYVPLIVDDIEKRAATMSEDEDEDESAYTSEVSDEEKFAVQLQKDSEARDNRATQQTANTSQERQGQLSVPQQQQQQSKLQHLSHLTGTSAASAVGNAPATVELCCSHFTFAQTPATADLHQLRLSVRLSSDITTTEPTPGPLSSYIHPVPFQQSSICLHFDVCNYSEDRSKLVLEAYKVIADTEVDNNGDNDAWDVRGPRHVSREELLGLSVVGLYRQSREVVFRDPVLDSSNVFAQLDIRVSPTAAIDTGDAYVGAADSPSTTPASDSVPPRSGAESSAALRSSFGQKTTQHETTQRTAELQPPSPRATTQEPRPETGGAMLPTHTAAKGNDHSFSSAAMTLGKSQLNSHLSVAERRRLRVVVHSAVELPRVAVAQQSGNARALTRFPVVSSSPRVLLEAGVSGADRYVEPSSFVTVEEIFQSAHESLVGAESRRGETPKSRALLRPMANWYVDEARSGFYDRSAVAEQSSNPYYDYEVILQLPEVAPLLSAEEAATGVTRCTSVNDTTTMRGNSTVDVLEEVQMNVWHSDPSRRAALSEDHNVGGATAHAQEEDFWTCAAYMGTCRVDLRPLRYLSMINGYYRVVCERTPSNATDQTDADTDANTIGYMRLSVSLL